MHAIEQLCKDAASDDQVKAYKARQAANKLLGELGAPKQSERAAAAAAMAGLLTATKEVSDPKKPKDAPRKEPANSAKIRNATLRFLSSIAGPAEVPAIRQCLDDFDCREMARWALDRMTCAEATDALVAAATSAIGNEFRVGAINALGRRAGSNVVEALKKCCQDSEVEVRYAAAEALANLPDAAYDALITATAKEHSPGGGRKAKSRLGKARVRLAATLAAAGDKAAAKQLFGSIAESDCDEAQQRAARAAIKRLG